MNRTPKGIRPSSAFCLLAIVISLAGYPWANASGQGFRQITTRDGLSNNLIPDILQDRTGFMWIATQDGLNRYDGYQVRVYRNVSGDSESLSDNSLRALLEDRNGYLWIGTNAGNLNRYDQESDTFRHWAVPSDLVRDNPVTTLFEDHEGAIWVGTYRSGLYRFDPKTGHFDSWRHDPADPGSLSHNYVLSINEDAAGRLLVATYNGLNRMKAEQGIFRFETFYSDPANQGTISHNVIWALTPSRHFPGRIWLGTAAGLTAYETDRSEFIRYAVKNPEQLQFGESSGYLVEDNDEEDVIIWLSTYGGLLRINLHSGDVVRFQADPARTGYLSSNQINKVYRDRSGVLWIATQNGLNLLSPKVLRFNTLPGSVSVSGLGKLKSASVTSITSTPDGINWFGTENGLYHTTVKSPGGNAVSVIPQPDFEGMNIWALAACPSGRLWIGTYGSGLYALDPVNGRRQRVDLTHPWLRSPSAGFIRSLWCDADETLWIGFWGLGLARLEQINGVPEVYRHGPEVPLNGLSHNDVWVIFRDSSDRLWIGTSGGGLNLLVDEQQGRFMNWTEDESPHGSINGNVIYTITETVPGSKTDEENPAILWVGTNGGLNRIELTAGDAEGGVPGNVRISAFTIEHGLADPSVKSLLADPDGNLWIVTNSGISHYNLADARFINYSGNDGITGGNFNPNSAFRSGNGIHYFGGQSGLNYFTPSRLRSSDYNPPLVITGFSILNETVMPATGGLMERPAHMSDEVNLKHNQNMLSFEFAALDFNAPEAVQYAYRLEPFDGDWTASGNRRFVTYTNLNPGRYVFRVRATNADGIWGDQEAAMMIRIAPPWWRTPWAYLLYGLLTVAVIVFSKRAVTNRMLMENELKMSRFEAEQKEELEKIKSRLFANLSHEFRTPIQLMKGPLELLLAETPRGRQSERYQMMYRNAERLQALIDQMLELSRLEEARILVRAAKLNLITPLRGLVYSFESLATEKGIRLEFICDKPEIWCWVDSDKLEKIVNNLLSNAFKFSASGSAIRVILATKMMEGRNYAELTVSDEGSGIPEQEVGRIFERFYQVDDPLGRNFGGSGIGLALVKELVDLHRWEITVESRVNSGTNFRVTIPLRDDYLGEDSKVRVPDGSVSIDTGKMDTDIADTHLSDTDEDNTAGYSERIRETPGVRDPLTGDMNGQNFQVITRDRASILLVEDSADVRRYISDLAGDKYTVLQAENGLIGLEMAMEHVPDLIISDVMMPGIDGVEFCRMIKSEMITSHIPVILLTARSSENSRIRGLETGADDYLAKPFSGRELLVRISNLLEQRRRLRELFGRITEGESGRVPDPGGRAVADDGVVKTKATATVKESAADTPTVTDNENKNETYTVTSLEHAYRALRLNALDRQFIEKVRELTRKHIGDAAFDTSVMAKELFMSRMQLHRKMLGVTGHAPGDFIREHRLRHAALLLEENRLSVTQISYEIGYSSASQFSRAFTKQFGVNPSEYRVRRSAGV